MIKIQKQKNIKIEKIQYIELIKSEFYIGCKKSRWNPLLVGFIYKIRKNIYILNLEYTVYQLRRGLNMIKTIIRNRGQVLMVVLKKKVSNLVKTLLKKSKQGYVDYKYYKGSLIHFKESKKLLYQKISGNIEVDLQDKTCMKMLGYKNLQKKPSAVIITQTNKSDWLIRECNRLRIPTICFIDTNTMSMLYTYSIVGNSNTNKHLNLILLFIYHAIFQGIRLDTKAFNNNYNLTQKIINKLIKVK
uniref:Ribosomal protein S2 n=1 Tax=Heterostelium pallidum TaxID=13642 RepID=Q5ILJ6_HETPA|nr:ribosomal protein S2 [Heterostelium pallidum]AAU00614.1 ribosomal protein S2 [Heterostelium pallidum]